MMRRCGVVALLCVAVMGQGMFPGSLSPDIANRVQENRTLQRGGSAVFDDCLVAVGTAAYRAERASLARCLARASARAELASLVFGVNIHAEERIENTTQTHDEEATSETQMVSEITSKLEKARQNAIRPGGEWLSEDGGTLFVCLYQLVNDAPGRAGKALPLPEGIQDWKVAPEWEDALRSAPGILTGGSTLYRDDYGEEFLLLVVTCPGKYTFSQKRAILPVKARTAALSYMRGTMVSDLRYIRETTREQSANEEDSQKDDLIVRHYQTLITEGEFRGLLTDIGTWEIDGGRTTANAFAVCIKDLTTKCFDVMLPGTVPSDADTWEMDVEDESAATLLRRELPKAKVHETEREIILLLPENSALFAAQEQEIVLVDYLLTPVPPPPGQPKGVQLVLRQPERIHCHWRPPSRRCHVSFPRRPPTDRHLHRRTYLPARIRGVPHPRHETRPRRPPKSIILRRCPHGASPRQHIAPPPRPPRFRVRCPKRSK
ncbi:MAG: hypothetical protein IJJ33_01210 [Victivallales bacterium]|nr:hypothetical protein [Victivallales bacterium]